jgi:hypothetical protein
MGDPSLWAAKLRVKSAVNAPGVFEMMWSFSGPDGRATPGRQTGGQVRCRRKASVRCDVRFYAGPYNISIRRARLTA